jgi:excisionase family DNA binding protein
MANDVRLLYGVGDASKVLGIGITLMRELVAGGYVASILIGRRRLVPLKALEEYIEQQSAVSVD